MNFRKKKLIGLVVVLSFLVILTGCFDGGVTDIVPDEGNGGLGQVSHLKVTIDWEDIEKISNSHNDIGGISALNSTNDSVARSDVEISVVGTRILYPQYGGAWTQYVDRETAEEIGIITYELPATDNAELHVVTASHGENNNYVLDYGVIEKLNIPSGEILELTVDDIEWSEATWFPDEDFEDFQEGLSEDDLLIGSYNDYRYFPIYLYNPFQLGEIIRRDHQYIRVYGWTSQSSEEYKPGYRKVDINHDMTKKEQHFQPFFEGSTFFNLPKSQYYIFPLVKKYDVEWNSEDR